MKKIKQFLRLKSQPEEPTEQTGPTGQSGLTRQFGQFGQFEPTEQFGLIRLQAGPAGPFGTTGRFVSSSGTLNPPPRPSKAKPTKFNTGKPDKAPKSDTNLLKKPDIGVVALKQYKKPLQNTNGQLKKIKSTDQGLHKMGNGLLPQEVPMARVDRDLAALRAQGAIPKSYGAPPNVAPILPRGPPIIKKRTASMERHGIDTSRNIDRIMIDNDGFERLPSYASSEGLSMACALPDVTTWNNYEWEKDQAVTDLKDKLLNMEKAHHSTSEELQATLQELTDLQRQLSHLHEEFDEMVQEKHVLLESLCHQTEKLEAERTKVGTLEELLVKEDDGETSERELKLVDLLKSAQEERDTLLLKQEELNSQLTELRNNATSDGKVTSRLEERISVLESSYNALKAEKEQVEAELTASKEDANSSTIEINRLNTLLDHAKSKITDLEQTRALTDKSDLEEVIDITRKEKDNLETQVAHLQEQLSKSKCEVNKLTEQLEKLQEELKVSRNNAKSAVSDMEYNMEKLKCEFAQVTESLQDSGDLINELHIQVRFLAEDKMQLEAVLDETHKSLANSEKKLRDMEKLLNDKIAAHHAETLEWEQFRSDLLVTVRVANDIKTEAVTKAEALADENIVLRDKLKSMEIQIQQFKAKEPSGLADSSSASASVLSCVQQDLQDLATRRRRQDNRLSVKSLIESIENATKQAKADPGNSGIDYAGSMDAASYDGFLPEQSNGDDTRERKKTTGRFTVEPAGEHQSALVTKMERQMSCSDIGEKDPLVQLAKNGGSKRNALLKWCQSKTEKYHNIDITNFSTSWKDGLALCALLDTYLPDIIQYDTLASSDARKNFYVAFFAAESVGIRTTLDVDEMVQTEKPNWKLVMDYVTAIYKHFESD